MVKTETEDKPVEEKTEKGEAVQLTEVVTQTAPAVKLPDGTVVGMEEYFVWLGNMVYHIKKNTG